MKIVSSYSPDRSVRPYAKDFTRDELKMIGNTLRDAIAQARADRKELDEQLDIWNALYEMEVEPTKFPWPNASNVFIPFLPTQVDTLQARLAALVYQPRLYLVEGKTPDAAQCAHEVEMFYNAGLAQNSRRREHYDYLFLSIRDGLALMDVLWQKVTASRKMQVAKPKLVGGMPYQDPKTGEIEVEWEDEEVTVTISDDYKIEAVELRDFVYSPVTAQNVDSAALVARRMLFSESQLRAMTLGDDPELMADAVERVIQSVSVGTSELNQQAESKGTYEAGGAINPSGAIASGSTALPTFARELSVYRVNTNIFDLDGDSYPEEAVAWLHEQTGELLGIRPYRYLHGKRSLVALSCMPRAKRLVGFSLVGRLAPIQLEINAMHNSRNNQTDMRLNPPRYKKEGAKINQKDRKWGPDVEYDVTDPNDVGILDLPPISQDAMQEEMLLQNYGQSFSGLSNPMTGSQSSGRRSAREVGIQEQSAGIRNDLMAVQVREAERQIFEQIHGLTKQYGPDTMEATSTDETGKPTQLQIDKKKLLQDYVLSVAGLGAPIDQKSRLEERLFIFSQLKEIPYIANSPIYQYRLVRFLLEGTGVPDFISLIGSEQDAMQRQQDQMQQQQMMMAQQQMMQGGGQPPQQQGPPQGGGNPTL